VNRAEKIERLQAKAAELVQWFEGRELPKPPFKVSPWATVTNTDRYMEVISKTFKAYHDNPMAAPYVAAYYQLLTLKTYLENGL
jgi:hypothetical protein